MITIQLQLFLQEWWTQGSQGKEYPNQRDPGKSLSSQDVGLILEKWENISKVKNRKKVSCEAC
jgi:hypothetical protein